MRRRGGGRRRRRLTDPSPWSFGGSGLPEPAEDGPVEDWWPMAGPKTAFVLAGGGTKGAFEAGAIRYLVEEEQVFPQIVTAASAGAVAAAVLAQARTPQEFSQRSAELRSDLLAMTHIDQLFAKQPWVESLDGTPFGRVIDSYLTVRTRPPVPGDDLDPILGPPTRHRWSRRALDLLAGSARAIRRLPRTSRGLRGNTGSVLTLDPLARALRVGGPSGILPIDPDLIARPGLELRLAVTALGAGVLRYVTEDGTIVADDARTPVDGRGAGPVDVIEAVLASASVPMVFPPRPLADDVYVDGGVLQNIPVEAAVRLGAERIVAVLAVPLAPEVDRRDFTRLNLMEVFLRTVGTITFTDRQVTNLRYPRPDGVSLTVIDPVIDVVGPFEVAPGLMLLDMDYGWLRAADVMAPLAATARAEAERATDALVIARTRCWHLEESIWRGGQVGWRQQASIRDLKAAVREAVTEREKLGLATPPDAERWWSDYESHDGPRPAALAEDPFSR
jgi:NTE family protein